MRRDERQGRSTRRRQQSKPVARTHRVVDPESACADPLRGGGPGHFLLDHDRQSRGAGRWLVGRPGSRGLTRGSTYRAVQFYGSTSIVAISLQEKMHVAD
jgi:hypothetical protein